jgi:hypothetical protein
MGGDAGEDGPLSVIGSCHTAYSVVAPSTPSWRSPSFSYAERLPPVKVLKPSAKQKAMAMKARAFLPLEKEPSDAGSLPRELKDSILRLGKQEEVAGDPVLRAQILADYWKMMGRSDAASAANTPRSGSAARSAKPFVETHVDEEGHVHHYHYIPVAPGSNASAAGSQAKSAASRASRTTPRAATPRAATPRSAPKDAGGEVPVDDRVIYEKDGARDINALLAGLESQTTTADSAGQSNDDPMKKLSLEKLLLKMRKCHFDVLNRAKPSASKHSDALTPRGRISRAADIPGLRESSPTANYKKSLLGMDLRRYK